MPYRDPRCVFVANDFGQADVVAGWLGGRGIAAQVMNQATHGGLVSPLLTGAVGVEVWVVDPAQAAEAVRLLGEHAVAQVARELTGPPVEVVCEECGRASTFPARYRGTVQVCAHCAAYLDVGDPEASEEPHDLDEPEGDERGGPRSDGITDGGRWGLTKP
jgi:hypothetical protein